jgi:hypothetical protein
MTTTEKDILINVRNIVTELLVDLVATGNKLTDAKRDITNLGNNYFRENQNMIHSCSIPNILERIASMQQYLCDCEDAINYNLDNLCEEHEWTDDEIDVHPEKSLQITYCRKCDVSKKQ